MCISCVSCNAYFVASGSVKSNIGHLEAASGLAGVVKSILMLEKGVIPPNALFDRLSPAIEAQGHHVEASHILIASHTFIQTGLDVIQARVGNAGVFRQ